MLNLSSIFIALSEMLKIAEKIKPGIRLATLLFETAWSCTTFWPLMSLRSPYLCATCKKSLLLCPMSSLTLYILMNVNQTLFDTGFKFTVHFFAVSRTCHLAGLLLRSLKTKWDKEWREKPELKPMDITEKDIIRVQIAALCHDIGKQLNLLY